MLVLAALAGAASAQQYVFRGYRQGSSLNNLSVSAVSFDPKGFLWVGTQNGLYRFLGSGFQRFGRESGIHEAMIADVLAAPDGSVWAGTEENLYRWTGRGFEPSGPKPIPIWRARDLWFEAPGRLLVVKGNRLYRLSYGKDGDPSSLAAYFPAALVASHPVLQRLAHPVVAPDGTLWVGCGPRLCSWRDGKLTEWGGAQGVPDEECRALAADGRGSVWERTADRLVELAKGAGGFVDRTPPGRESAGAYSSLPLAVDPQGRVLISAEDGIARWNGSAWRTIGRANGLWSTHITAMAFDARGDLWMGSTGHGLHHWTGYNQWEGWSNQQGLPSDNIWSLGLFQDGEAYVGTEKGPARIDLRSGAAQRLFRTAEWPYGQVSGLAMAGGGALVAATRSGSILRIRAATGQVKRLAQLPEGYVYGLAKAPSGRIFILTGPGLYFLDGIGEGAAPRLATEAAALDSAAPTAACLAPDGRMWFVTEDAVLRWRDGPKGGTWTRPSIRWGGAPARGWRAISCAVDGTLWATGSDSGAWHLREKEGALEATELAPPPEYRTLALIAVLSDARGWLWLGTDAGVLVWNGSAWRHLTQENGLIWNDVNSRRMAEGADGSIWIGTSGGLGHLTHPERVFDKLPLSIAMIDVRRGPQSLSASELAGLPWSGPELSFQFAAPTDANRGDLVFRYRIPQLQSEWVETRDTTAHFSALPPGRYAFEVSARNSAIGAASEVVSTNFRILPPWWKTSWFYGLCGLAGLSLAISLHRLRTARLLRQSQRLERLVLERTIELEASQEELRRQATHDGLTRLLNRVAILSALDEEIARGRREGETLVVALADLDHFKRINDIHGHLAGDEALRRFAAALSENVRMYDRAGRYGGEEFLVVLSGVPPGEIADRLEELHSNISNLTVSQGETTFPITCSLGATLIEPEQDGVDPKAAMAVADLALYQAKLDGRNRYVLRSLSTELANG
jgi:diguanylate cyclase (GGDEF)-like protein